MSIISSNVKLLNNLILCYDLYINKEELIRKIKIIEQEINYYSKVYPGSLKHKKLLDKLNSLKKELESQSK